MANKILKTLNFGGNDIYDLSPAWENIRNLPFGYETPTGGDTLEWDGKTTGLVNVMGVLFHVSDAVPAVASGTVGIYSGGSVQTTQFTDVTDMGEGVKSIVVNNMPMVIIVPTAAVGVTVDGLKFNKAGIYLRNAGGEYVASLTIDGCKDFKGVKTIDNKYLPEHLQFGSEVTYVEIMSERELSPMGEGQFVALTGDGLPFECPPLTTDKTHTITWNGISYNTLCVEVDGVQALGNVGLASGGNDTGEPFIAMVFQEGGVNMLVAMALDGSETVTMSLAGETETVTRLNVKYLHKPFIIELTQEDNSDVWVANKQFHEIKKAHEQGLSVWINIFALGVRIPLNNITDVSATFVELQAHGQFISYIIFNSDEVISYSFSLR